MVFVGVENVSQYKNHWHLLEKGNVSHYSKQTIKLYNGTFVKTMDNNNKPQQQQQQYFVSTDKNADNHSSAQNYM